MEGQSAAVEVDLHFYVNGAAVTLKNADPSWTLVYYLREKRLLTGTKIACDQGGCGSCTVMVSSYDKRAKQVLHYAMNACLILLCSLDGKAVTTVEGVGSTKTVLHPIQEKLAKSHGTQCGFCSPGMIMSMYSLLRSNSKPSLEEIEKSISGNLCRCTGYRPIIQTFQKFADGGECAMGDQCCKNQSADNFKSLERCQSIVDKEDSQDFIFPPQLKLQDNAGLKRFSSNCLTWWSPSSLEDVLQLRKDYPNALLGAGYTIVANQQKGAAKHDIISLNRVSELQTASLSEDGIHFGAGLTMSQIASYSKQWLSTEKTRKLHYLEALCDILQLFGSIQIRNAATLGGHIAVAKATSDLLPLFQVISAKVLLRSKGGTRVADLSTDFITVQPNEIITGVLIPYSAMSNYCTVVKQSLRRELCATTCTVAVNVLFTDDNTCNVKHVTSACCGVNNAAVDTSPLIGQILDNKRIISLVENLQSHPLSTFSSCLAGSLLRKCLDAILEAKSTARTVSDIMSDCRPPMSACQSWQSEHKGEHMDCGKPLHHMAGLEHTTGEAQYVDDIPKVQGELFMCPVLSPIAHGKLISIDSSAALLMPGVIDCISYDDVKGSNIVGGVVVFVQEKIESQADVICAVLADSRNQARAAASAVKVKAEEYKPIITIQEAIQANSILTGISSMPERVTKGDIAAGISASDEVLSGEVTIGAQKHFYMEPQCCIITPGEKGEMKVNISIQGQVNVQKAVAEVTGVMRNRVKVITKRVGGGFGGKGYVGKQMAMISAVAAQKLSRPIRSVLERTTDTRLVGARESMLAKYEIGVKDDGTILAIEVKMFWNCGVNGNSTVHNSVSAVVSFESAYFIPHITLEHVYCKTNIAAAGFLRGIGRPQSVFIMETIFDHVASHLSIDAVELKRKHLMKENDLTIYGQRVTGCNMQACWDRMMEQSKYAERQKAVNEFNRTHSQKKKGMAVGVMMSGLPTFLPFLNHGEALVHIYTDGSVYVAHGGVEIGQGLHTKCAQIASRSLQISLAKIHIEETATNMTANSFDTAASCGTDLQGAAVKQACEELMTSLEPYKKSNPGGTWEQWVMSAHMDRAKLSASASIKVEGLNMDPRTLKGDNIFNYFLFGASLCEVEVDCLTGGSQILRTDIVLDVGESLNPAIDIGQIEGAFMQGFGLYCMEEIRYDDKGTLLTDGFDNYKIPGRMDAPIEFNVSLLPNAKGKSVYSSKGIGEPPLLLAPSTFFATKDAIAAMRRAKGLKGHFRMNSPMTNQEKLSAIGCHFIKVIYWRASAAN